MLDFIAEPRPRSLRLKPECPSGFVVEVRPSSRRSAESNLPTYQYDNSFTNQLHETDLKNTVNNGSVEKDLNDILSNKSLSKEKLKNVMHNSFVTLIKTLLTGHRVKDIKGDVRVNVAGCDETIVVNLNEIYSTDNVPVVDNSLKYEIMNNLKRKTTGPTKFEESPCDELRLSPICSLGASLSYRSEEASLAESSPVDDVDNQPFPARENMQICEMSQSFTEKQCPSPVHDNNEVESGYSSSGCAIASPNYSEKGEQENNLTELVNFDTPETDIKDLDLKHESVPERVSKTSSMFDNESKEVMDNTAVKENEETFSENAQDKTNDSVFKRPKIMKRFKDIEKEFSSCSESEMTTGESSVQESSSETDTDVPMGLPGDCETNVESASVEKKIALMQDDTRPQKSFACKKCPGVLLDQTNYQAHNLKKHQIYACSICMKAFSSKNNLKRHVRIHTGSRPYKCNQCDMSFARKDDLKGHTLKHDFSKPFRCSICKKGYTDRACVKNHMLKEHCSRYMKICPQCGESFDREEFFLEHKKSHFSLKQFACESCPFIGTNHLMASKHKLMHTFKLFTCKPCNAYFSNPFDYTKHVRKHKKALSFTNYVCCFCDATLPTYEQFVRHEYSHAQGKLNECGICKKQFKSKHAMNEHILSHAEPNSASNASIFVNTFNDEKVQHENTLEIAKTTSDFDKVPERQQKVSKKRFANDIEQHASHCAQHNDETPLNGSGGFEGELLDLTVRKSSLKEDQEPQVMKSMGSRISNLMTSSVSSYSVPRNGCAAIDTRLVVNSEISISQNSSDNHIANQSPEFELVRHNQNNFFNIGRDQQNNNGQFCNVFSKPPPLVMASDYIPCQDNEVKSIRNQNSVNNVRIHPYNNNMLKFAHKYLATRGSHLKNKLLQSGREIFNDNPRRFHNQHLENSRAYSLQRTEIAKQEKISNSITSFENNREKFENRYPPHFKAIDNAYQSNMVHDYRIQIPMTQNRHVVINENFCRVKTENPIPVFNQNEEGFQSSPIPNSTPEELKPKMAAPENMFLNKTMSPKKEISSCDICHRDFESFFHLESHSVITHNRYLCEFCGKGFTARPNRDRHVRYHTGERPYKCELCSSAFFRGDDLKYHRTTRHPMEQISCNRCNATFTWKKDLERHLRHSKCLV